MDIAQENRVSTGDEDYATRSKLGVEAQREIIRQSLPGLASEIGMLIRDAGFSFPVFISLPHSGNAIVTLATPLDPSDAEWAEAAKIAYEVIARILGGIRLCGRPLDCAIARATMSACDVVADVNADQ